MRFLLLLLLTVAVWGEPSAGRFHAFRLGPGEDLRERLIGYVKDHDLRAVAVVTTVGSLQRVRLRLAGRSDVLALEGPLEIVSLVGTLSPDGVHLHLSVADGEGHVKGGHLVEHAPVYTTAEIVLVELTELEFSRELEPRTGFPELMIRSKQSRP